MVPQNPLMNDECVSSTASTPPGFTHGSASRTVTTCCAHVCPPSSMRASMWPTSGKNSSRQNDALLWSAVQERTPKGSTTRDMSWMSIACTCTSGPNHSAQI